MCRGTLLSLLLVLGFSMGLLAQDDIYVLPKDTTKIKKEVPKPVVPSAEASSAVPEAFFGLSVGATGGLGSSYLLANQNFRNAEFGTGSAWQAGLDATVELLPTIFMEVGLVLGQRTFGLEVFSDTSRNTGTWRRNEFTVPLMVKYQYINTNNFFLGFMLGARGTFSFGTEFNAIESRRGTVISDVTVGNDTRLRGTDYGLLSGLYLGVPIKRYVFKADVLFDFGLTDLNNNALVTTTGQPIVLNTRGTHFRLGVAYKLFSRK